MLTKSLGKLGGTPPLGVQQKKKNACYTQCGQCKCLYPFLS